MHILFIFLLYLSKQINIITGHKDKHGVPMGIKIQGCDTGEVEYYYFF